ncbi:Tol-Pal system protein TolB [Acrasis kona]|uniref:Tol-Pal system protein TolB n=1 Tax=Acrasis kona TaxID=1008807 RepID=A0AAW2Z8U7_9EUKA
MPEYSHTVENETIIEKITNNKIVVGIGFLVGLVFIALVSINIIQAFKRPSTTKTPVVLQGDETKYFTEIKRATQGGVNAEAYWSFDSTKLVFQGIRDGHAPCDQIFTMNADGTDVKQVSVGEGKTTCGYYLKDGKSIIYSSSMDTYGKGCPPAPDSSFGYVWAVYKMNMYKADATTGQIIKNLTSSDYYEAEGTLSPDGNTIVFTSTRDGDLELYTMDTNGDNVKRLTYTPGYDGGAFFSHDGKKIVWRANRPRGSQLGNYLDLLKLGLVEPVNYPMDIYIMNSDGSNQKKLTNIGGANFAPSFLPDDSGIIFASNQNHGDTRQFHLYIVDVDGKNLRRVTTGGTYNLFPHFSYDGKYLSWSSDRDASAPHLMDVYVAKVSDLIKKN